MEIPLLTPTDIEALVQQAISAAPVVTASVSQLIVDIHASTSFDVTGKACTDEALYALAGAITVHGASFLRRAAMDAVRAATLTPSVLASFSSSSNDDTGTQTTVRVVKCEAQFAVMLRSCGLSPRGYYAVCDALSSLFKASSFSVTPHLVEAVLLESASTTTITNRQNDVSFTAVTAGARNQRPVVSASTTASGVNSSPINLIVIPTILLDVAVNGFNLNEALFGLQRLSNQSQTANNDESQEQRSQMQRPFLHTLVTLKNHTQRKEGEKSLNDEQHDEEDSPQNNQVKVSVTPLFLDHVLDGNALLPAASSFPLLQMLYKLVSSVGPVPLRLLSLQYLALESAAFAASPAGHSSRNHGDSLGQDGVTNSSSCSRSSASLKPVPGNSYGKSNILHIQVSSLLREHPTLESLAVYGLDKAEVSVLLEALWMMQSAYVPMKGASSNCAVNLEQKLWEYAEDLREGSPGKCRGSFRRVLSAAWIPGALNTSSVARERTSTDHDGMPGEASTSEAWMTTPIRRAPTIHHHDEEEVDMHFLSQHLSSPLPQARDVIQLQQQPLRTPIYGKKKNGAAPTRKVKLSAAERDRRFVAKAEQRRGSLSARCLHAVRTARNQCSEMGKEGDKENGLFRHIGSSSHKGKGVLASSESLKQRMIKVPSTAASCVSPLLLQLAPRLLKAMHSQNSAGLY